MDKSLHRICERDPRSNADTAPGTANMYVVLVSAARFR